MVTAIDKALAAFLPSVILYVNQKWGLHMDSSPEAIGVLVGLVSAILVYFIPNKTA